MQTKTVVRIGAVAFVALALTVSALQLRMSPGPVEPDRAGAPLAAGTNTLWPELVRCQSIGAAGATDRDCLRAWAENRRRFLAPGARPAAVLPTAPVVNGSASNEAGIGVRDQTARDAPGEAN
ncbi:putative entry exclusion protein TrbK-alt [Sphingomonas sp. PWP1-2]|uniref:putative entry exclusion protein TrbK-alt n=1 Tax=Sphingomonas sp. PWP1-2 TaxID=2804558 RepID=UPI003CE74E0A